MVPPTSYELLDPKPELVPYEDLESLFQAMATHRETHPGAVFVRADMPKERCIGFWDVTHQTGWHVQLVTLIYGPKGLGGEREWRKLFLTAATRAELAAQLTLGQFPKGPSTISVDEPPQSA